MFGCIRIELHIWSSNFLFLSTIYLCWKHDHEPCISTSRVHPEWLRSSKGQMLSRMLLRRVCSIHLIESLYSSTPSTPDHWRCGFHRLLHYQSTAENEPGDFTCRSGAPSYVKSYTEFAVVEFNSALFIHTLRKHNTNGSLAQSHLPVSRWPYCAPFTFALPSPDDWDVS